MLRLLILIALAVAAYVPALKLPFIEDDYDEIQRAQTFASTGWSPLWHYPALRTRATAVALDAAITRIWGFHPRPFYIATIALHVLCTLLLYAAFTWSEMLNASITFWAACFFAIYEGHQEAVMWISAKNESLVFLFGMATWLCWVRFLRTRKPHWYALSCASFLLAALSKESFVIFPVLMLLPCIWPPPGTTRRTALIALLPFFLAMAGYVAWSWFARFAQPSYADNRFSLTAAWPLVLLRSLWRLLFIWGLVAIAVLFATARRIEWTRAGIAIAWMVIAIVPYSFLTYMPQIASRHGYIASAGLALLVGTAAARLSTSNHRTVLTALASLALILNLEILWVKKVTQFRERAEPSELLKSAARQAQGPITVYCTPFPDFLNDSVLASAGSHAILAAPGTHSDTCFKIAYTNLTGQRVEVDRRIRTAKHSLFY